MELYIILCNAWNTEIGKCTFDHVIVRNAGIGKCTLYGVMPVNTGIGNCISLH